MSNSKQVMTIKCPFDPSHVMPYERFLNHLQKCQFPDKKSYRKCKYNPYHVHHMNIIADHQKNCKSKNKYDEEDDDWGIDSPEEEIVKQEKSQISISTLTSNSKSSLYNSKESVEISNQKPQYGKNNKEKEESKMTKIENSNFKAQDLDSFNPLEKQKNKGEKKYKKKQDNKKPVFEVQDL